VIRAIPDAMAAAPATPAASVVPVAPVAPVASVAPVRAQRQLRLVRDRAVPILRWAGGKTRLLDDIVSRVPVGYRRYLEPFCGGGAVFFRIAPPRAIVSDSSVELIEFYRELARDPVAVCRELGLLIVRTPLAAYYDVRAAWNAERTAWPAARRAATFLYLNKSCYNGLWRVNSRGEFNVPRGKFGPGGAGDPGYPSLGDFLAASAALRRAEICCEDYAVIFDRAERGDFVYVDPPYPPASKTANFVGYAAGGFDEAAHRLLAERVLALVARGVDVMVSQPDVPLAREIYAGLALHEVSAPRSVNSRGAGRGFVPELLLIGGSSS